MHNKHHTNFRDVKEHMERKEPTAQEHNSAQLINWLADVKTELKKISEAMTDYRLQQMKQIMEFKEYIGKLMGERRDVEKMMEMILQHLTAPGQLTNYAGALMPSEDVIALKVAELLKRPLLVAKAMEASAAVQPDPSTSCFPASNDEEKQEVDNSLAQDDSATVQPRKRITYKERIDAMMLTIMRQGGEWDTDRVLAALVAKYPHTTFKKQSVASAFTLLMNQQTIFRVDRGIYQAKEQARG